MIPDVQVLNVLFGASGDDPVFNIIQYSYSGISTGESDCRIEHYVDVSV